VDDNEKEIEPEWFLPILPMVLINGTEGIGTGYSTFIPSHNPLYIVANIKRLLKGEAPVEMVPYFRGYKGKIYEECGKYYSSGTYHILPTGNMVEITELPIGMSIEKYKTVLEGLMIDKTEKVVGKLQKQCITEYVDNSTDVEVNFKVKFTPTKLKAFQTAEPEKLEAILKLKSSDQLQDTNMHLFNAENKMTKYETQIDILIEFFTIRLSYYQKRRDYLYQKYKNDLDLLKEKIRFIELFITDQLNLVNRDDEDIVKSLEEHNFIKFSALTVFDDKDTKDDDEEVNDEETSSIKEYNYLVGMSIRTLTKKRMEELKKQREEKHVLFNEINKKTAKQLWLDDLEEFVVKYEAMMEEWKEKMENDVVKKITPAGKKKLKVVK
jgi:DNA topoisomerase-2